jgi:DNA-binding IclR family transcriptional regulator
MNLLQVTVMTIICEWCKKEKEPITLTEIASRTGDDTLPHSSLKATMRSLERQGYVRKAIRTKKTSYVKVRGL